MILTRNSKATGLFFFTALLLISSGSSSAQQANLQTSFLAPAAVRTPNPGIGATIVESENLPYLKQVAKETTPAPSVFRPNASDLLIQ
jgi:hypothetical protein